MKTYEQLMQHYWGVIVPMAEAAGIDPWECVKNNGDIMTTHPYFGAGYMFYTFALTVLEGKPVFVGDKLYSRLNGEFEVRSLHLPILDEKMCTWTPPTKKRTFMLGDKELTCPVNDYNGCRLSFLGVDYYFETMRDRNNVASAINNMLAEARDKE